MGQWLQLYPNPAQDQIELQLSVGLPAWLQLQIYSITGQLMEESILVEAAGGSLDIDISDYSSGLYVLRMTDKQGQSIDQVKFVKL